MILEFSRPLIAILLLCFIVVYKYLCRKELLINFILDFIVGVMILNMVEDYFTDQIKHFAGHGSVLLFVNNFFVFTLLYLISTSVLYWKKSKFSGLIVPTVVFALYTILFFSESGFSKGTWSSSLITVFIAFFPIYIFNYFRVLYWYFNPERK